MPVYDGVFCRDGILSLDPLNTFQKTGVQAQIFTIVNDEDFYYPDLIHGMIVDGEMGQHITKYTVSTTGQSQDNAICSSHMPIMGQVDHQIDTSRQIPREMEEEVCRALAKDLRLTLAKEGIDWLDEVGRLSKCSVIAEDMLMGKTRRSREQEK